jgi:hypothetical protein
MAEPSDIFRDYQKHDAQQLELLQQRVHAIREQLSPAALAKWAPGFLFGQPASSAYR